jgi:hypothetical protein
MRTKDRTMAVLGSYLFPVSVKQMSHLRAALQPARI